GLSKRQRRKLHSRAASAIQKVYRGKLARVMGALAYHFNAAGEWQQAFQFGLKAVGQALEQESLSDVARYAQWVEDAAAAIAESPDDYEPIDPLVLGDILVKHAHALVRSGNVAGSVVQAEAALKIAQQNNDNRLVARSKAMLCQLCWYQGRFSEAIKIADQG